MPPALSTAKAVGKTPKPPALALSLDTSLPSLHIRNQLNPPWGASEQGNLLLVFAPPCCSRGPNEALPEFLVWPLINFYWLGKAKNPGQHHNQRLIQYLPLQGNLFPARLYVSFQLLETLASTSTCLFWSPRRWETGS